jgi:hypothetical protein
MSPTTINIKKIIWQRYHRNKFSNDTFSRRKRIVSIQPIYCSIYLQGSLSGPNKKIYVEFFFFFNTRMLIIQKEVYSIQIFRCRPKSMQPFENLGLSHGLVRASTRETILCSFCIEVGNINELGSIKKHNKLISSSKTTIPDNC